MKKTKTFVLRVAGNSNNKKVDLLPTNDFGAAVVIGNIFNVVLYIDISCVKKDWILISGDFSVVPLHSITTCNLKNARVHLVATRGRS